MELTQENEKRLVELVKEYAQRHNWSAVTRLIGGNPREDLQDYRPEDAGEPPKSAQW